MGRTVALMLVFVPVAVAAEPPAPATTRPSPPAFIVGVFMQPVESFDSWRARGINTLVGYESRSGRVSNNEWSAAAAAKGLYYIRRPGDDLAADAADGRLLALMHDDEPDAQVPPTDPTALAADFATWKRAAPHKPVFVNFSGGGVLAGDKDRYVAYSAAADWIGSDFYAVTGYGRPDWLWKVGSAVDRLRGWSGGKPQFCFVETSNQRLPWMPRTSRGVTPDELRALVWHSVIHGARGVVYFPQQLGDKGGVPFRFDATPQAVSTEMARQNARLGRLQDVLAMPANPLACAITADPPLEVGWRMKGDELYIVALNFSDDRPATAGVAIDAGGLAGTSLQVVGEPRQARLTGGRIVDDFGPYAVHVYRVTRPSPKARGEAGR
jgi:hypothetical protein